MSATAAVRERPIPFSGEMVRAILGGRKSETRRVVKPQPIEGERIVRLGDTWQVGRLRDSENAWQEIRCPFGSPGERLWIREAWRYAGSSWSGETPTIRAHAVEYAADGKYGEHYLPADQEAVPPHVCRCKDSDEHREQLLRRHSRVRPPMFMPRWASRLTLELDEVRVERLQEITEEGAIAEGVIAAPGITPGGSIGMGTARYWFMRGWDKLHAKRPERQWASNCWVWVLRFHVAPQEVAGA